MTAAVAIPPGQEALMRAMLSDDCRVPAGWRFDSAAVARVRVRVRYVRDDGAELILSLEHPDNATDPARRTARFAIGVEQATDRGDAAPLLDAVAASVSEHEARWRWAPDSDSARSPIVDIELAALLAGVKPGVRMTVPLDDAEPAAARYRAAGVAAVTLGRPAIVRDEPMGVVYAAATEQAAAHLRDVESAFFERQVARTQPPESSAYHHRLGELLGYPPCCVDAFCDVSSPVDGVDDSFRSARSAWTAAPLPRLNDLLRVECASLISFAPCSFECRAAAAVADAIAKALGAQSADALARFDELLARPLLIAASGFRAHVELDRGAGGSTIRAATPLSRRRGAAPTPDDVAVARALPGQPVDATGRTRSERAGDAVVVDFGARGAAKE